MSNLKLGAGIAPLPAISTVGVRLGLGTDSVASNNTLDLFEEIKTGALVQRGLAADPAAVAGDGTVPDGDARRRPGTGPGAVRRSPSARPPTSYCWT